jgi:mRNA-degrading endonuclease YafQ of YafQ-DinJ toxin-antitoxin module
MNDVMFSLETLESFWKNYQKIVKGNSVLKKQVQSTLEQLIRDPFYPSLKTHKVDTKKYDNVWSSRVSGDVRVVWSFDKNNRLVILVLELGTHSGANQVYKNKS